MEYKLKNLRLEQAFLESGASCKNKHGEIDYVRKDCKREIFEQECLIAETEGPEGWNDVGRFVLDQDPRIQKFVYDEMMACLGHKMQKRMRKKDKKTMSQDRMGRKSPRSLFKFSRASTVMSKHKNESGRNSIEYRPSKFSPLEIIPMGVSLKNE